MSKSIIRLKTLIPKLPFYREGGNASKSTCHRMGNNLTLALDRYCGSKQLSKDYRLTQKQVEEGYVANKLQSSLDKIYHRH